MWLYGVCTIPTDLFVRRSYRIRSRLSILEVGKQSISQRLQVDSESIDRFDINLLFDGFVLAIEEHPTLVGFSD